MIIRSYIFVDDVADGRLAVPVLERPVEEGDERRVVHVDLVDLVEDFVDNAAINDILRLHWNHVFL